MLCFDFIYNTIEQPIFVISTDNYIDFTIDRANKSALELIKYETDEVLGLSPGDIGLFTSANDWKLLSDMKHGESLKTVSKIRAKNQTEISSELSISKYKSDSEELIIVFQRNIGGSQKILEALRQSEYRFLRMAESVLEGIIIEESGKVVFVNSAMQTITGYSRDEIAEMDYENLARDDEKERLEKFKNRIKDKINGSISIEYWIKTKRSDDKCINMNVTVSARPDGRKLTYTIISDVSERKRTEDALLKSKADFQMLAENSPDIITRYNPRLFYTYANNSANKILAKESDTIVGKNNKILEIESSVASFIEDMHLEVFRTGRTVKFEFRLTQPGGDIKVFQANMVPEITDGGKVNSVLNIARDITQIKNIEKNLKDEQQFLISENKLLAYNIELWYNSIKEKSDTDVVEKLKPLSKIATWTQYKQIQHDYKPETLIIGDFIEEYFKKIKREFSSTLIELVQNIPEFKISVFTDSGFLVRIFDILLENALEATTMGKIELGFDIYSETEIVCFVKDTGCGIEPENADSVFEPFTVFNKENHLGLGLSIADKLTDTVGGQIWCLSAPETGSTFCFTVPAEINESVLNAKEEEKTDWSDKNILIVEDTDNNFMLLQAILKKYNPNIDRSIYGKDAIEKVRNKKYDIILMDIQLPDTNGYEVTKEIRLFNKNVPIIAQTAFAMYDNVVKALEVGCNDFLTKPIKSKKLISMIEQYF